VFQTLALWADVLANLTKLWCLADDDLLAEGQG
jgi:hypothetical protein